MGGGYVLDFSNWTFQAFIMENCVIDIYDTKYDYGSGSKANRLRAFWNRESNYLVGKLIVRLLDHWNTQKILRLEVITQPEQTLYDECSKISNRLLRDVPIENIGAIQAYSDDKDFNILAKNLRESIEKNEPEVALDRLHTYTTKYIRQLCDNHNIVYDKNTSLNSLFGGYVKYLTQNKIIETEMTVRILKSYISILEAFNKVRNDKSFAHDNQVLNYNESILIFNGIVNAISFIESIEKVDKQNQNPENPDSEWDKIPF